VVDVGNVTGEAAATVIALTLAESMASYRASLQTGRVSLAKSVYAMKPLDAAETSRKYFSGRYLLPCTM
jgi:hypothetical protein